MVSSGQGTTNSRDKKSNALLKRYGLSVGDSIEFWPTAFRPYGGPSGMGEVTCATELQTVDVIAYGEFRKDWDFKTAVYEGDIQFAREDGGRIIIVVNRDSVMEVDWEEYVSIEESPGDSELEELDVYPLNGELLSFDEYDRALQKAGGTCCVCASPVTPNDVDSLLWDNDVVGHFECFEKAGRL